MTEAMFAMASFERGMQKASALRGKHSANHWKLKRAKAQTAEI